MNDLWILGVGGMGAVCGWIIPRLIAPWCHWRSQRLVIAAITAFLCLSMVTQTADRFAGVAFCILSIGLVALTLIDLRTHRLPREISYTTLGLGAPMLLVSILLSNDWYRLWGMVVGAGGALAVMSGLYWASRGGLGDGDVRLSPVLGANLGWIGPHAVISGFFMSFILGAIVGVVLLVFTAADRRTAIPFGPFLALGTLLALVLPSPVIAMFSFGL